MYAVLKHDSEDAEKRIPIFFKMQEFFVLRFSKEDIIFVIQMFVVRFFTRAFKMYEDKKDTNCVIK